MSLWDLDKDVAIKNYPESIQQCQQVEVRSSLVFTNKESLEAVF